RFLQDLEAWTKCLMSLQNIIQFTAKILTYSEKKVLLVDVELEYFKMVTVDQEAFFGRTCGFQFAQSLHTMLTLLLAGLATYHDTYNKSIPHAALTLATSSKYIMFPEQRAKKCANVFRDSDYLFCKSFWNLVDHDVIKIGPDPITLSRLDSQGDEVVINAPTASAGEGEPRERAASNIGSDTSQLSAGSGAERLYNLVNIKVLSSEVRKGMEHLSSKKSDYEISSHKMLPQSDHLIMHIHGGGFIATSSTTHENYLKPWALELEVPIVAVDYSLAPEYPFPQAIEECYYAYAWILKNADKLGWNGKNLILTGDSAGGNLVTVVTMKSIEDGLRCPDSLVCFYTPFLLGYSMSPSRVMAIMDPLLNAGFLWRCLADNSTFNCEMNTTESCSPEKHIIGSVPDSLKIRYVNAQQSASPNIQTENHEQENLRKEIESHSVHVVSESIDQTDRTASLIENT
ncbi:unnamed protein product, partial [Didymodactylos carnosus]